MKFLKNIFISIAAAAVAFGCSGNVDDSMLPVLSVSDTEIDLATETGATFTVKYNGEDVTSESEFFMSGSSGSQKGNIFNPEKEGAYTFHAEYNGKQSNTVMVNVIDTKIKVESRYERHVCLMEFTGAWCLPCYHGFNNMMEILSKPSLAKYKGNIHIAAFHSNSGGTDVMAIPATEDIFKLVNGVAYPTFSVDLRDSGALTDDGKSLLQPGLMASFNDWQSHCGVAVFSTADAAGDNVTIEVKVASELTADYRVVILVVEDKVVGSQKTQTYPEGQDDYIHKHVVRKVVTSYKGTFTGEKITDDGRIKAGEEASKNWNLALDSGWNPDNTQVYALVLDRNGYVNNMNVCPLMNGKADYRIKK